MADGTVMIDSEINTDGVETGAKEIENTVTSIKNSLSFFARAVKDIPNIVKYAFSSTSNAIKQAVPSVKMLQDEVDRYEDALYRAERAGYGLGDAPYDKAYAKLQKAKQAAENYKKKLSGVDTGQKKASRSGQKFNKSLKNTEKSSKKAGRGLGRMLLTSIIFSTVFKAISMITDGLKEGMDSLAQYSSNTNTALSHLMSAMTQLKNSFAAAFAPLIQYVEPALTRFINYLSQAVTYIGKLFAALTGKDYFEQAVGVQQDYAESLDKTSESAKKAQKQLASFDEAEALNFEKEEEQKKELTPSDMFQTVKIEAGILKTAADIKKVLAGLFKPLKESWDENGPYVLESLKYTASATKQLALDMGKSFMQVWNAEGYGKAITDDLLITFGNLTYGVGNLVKNFDKAWISGNTGTSILRHLGDIILDITGFFRQSSESIKVWTSDINFTPLLLSLDMVLMAIDPIVADIGAILLWLLTSVLLPLAKWGVEQALPSVFELISAALNVMHSIIEALKPLGIWLWESFLQPLGKWTGEMIIGALQKLVEWLTKFSDWAKTHQATIQNAAIIIAAFFAAWKFTQFMSGIMSMISVLPQLVGKLSALLGAVSPLTLAIGAIISVIGILAVSWDKMSPSQKVITSILAAVSAVSLLAVALGFAQGKIAGAVTLAGLLAGIAAVKIATSAGNLSTGYSAGNYSRSVPESAYSAVTYRMPRLATGTVVPPRAGEFAAILGDNKRETEVVSPLSTMKQALKEALLEAGINQNQSGGTAYLQIDGATFARIVLPYLDSEQNRIGVKLVT